MLNIKEMIYSLPIILLALTFHEFAHGYVAYRLGDPTPKQQGRLTLNPLAHLDILGTLMMIVARFGWAKPVQVNPLYFRGDKQRGMMKVAIAGPLANILIAFLGTILYNLFDVHGGAILDKYWYLSYFLTSLVIMNVYLAIFNLIPVPPLDGSKILLGIVPRQYHDSIYSLEAYGPLILMALILTNVTSKVLVPIAQVLINALNLIAYMIVSVF